MTSLREIVICLFLAAAYFLVCVVIIVNLSSWVGYIFSIQIKFEAFFHLFAPVPSYFLAGYVVGNKLDSTQTRMFGVISSGTINTLIWNYLVWSEHSNVLYFYIFSIVIGVAITYLGCRLCAKKKTTY